MDFETYKPFLISLGLGLLVGLQREYRGSRVAGIRTFPLISLLGTLVAVMPVPQSAWLLSAGFLGLASLLLFANFAKLSQHDEAAGVTTEVAALLMYSVGAALGFGLTGPAVVLAGVTAVLLHWKGQLHGFVKRIGSQDFRGLIQLVLIALVILPLLPNQTYGPYEVFNPYEIWLVVVLIVGISMVAYVAHRLLGPRVGAILGGVLGGLISSTATTVSFARMSRNSRDISAVAAVVVLIASTIVNARVMIELGVVAPKLLQSAVYPIALFMGVMAAECLVLLWWVRRQPAAMPEPDNPAQLKAAVIFGGLYAVILLVVAWAKDQFGTEALYGVAAVSGLTDVDAITLSTAQLFKRGRVDPDVGTRVVLIALLSNLIFKFGAVLLLGNRRLVLYTAATFGIALLAGLGLLLFWP